MATQNIPQQKPFTVGTSLVEILPEQVVTQPIVVYIKNISTGGQNIAIGEGQDAVIGSGINLAPNEPFIDVIDAAYTPTQLRRTAIADGAGGQLAVYIRLR